MDSTKVITNKLVILSQSITKYLWMMINYMSLKSTLQIKKKKEDQVNLKMSLKISLKLSSFLLKNNST